jgi:hypothetical protein
MVPVIYVCLSVFSPLTSAPPTPNAGDSWIMRTLKIALALAFTLFVMASNMPETLGTVLPTGHDLVNWLNGDKRSVPAQPRAGDFVPGPLKGLNEAAVSAAEGPDAPRGSPENITQGLGAILSGGIEGLSRELGEIFDAGSRLADAADGDNDAPSTPLSQCSAGTAEAGDIKAATAVLEQTDAGRTMSMARWEIETVRVQVTGYDVDDVALALIDDALLWLTDTTGTAFIRDMAGPVTVDLTAGNRPRATSTVRGSTIHESTVTWDPTREGACRWTYEELGQMAGALGDHGPVGALFSVDQSADGPSAFDSWLLRALYDAPNAMRTDIITQLEASS